MSAVAVGARAPKATAEVKAALQKHGQELAEALLALTKSDDERVRLGAIQACFDRGWGGIGPMNLPLFRGRRWFVGMLLSA